MNSNECKCSVNVPIDEFLALKGMNLEVRCSRDWKQAVDDDFVDFVAANTEKMDDHHLQCALGMLQYVDSPKARTIGKKFINDERPLINIAARAVFYGQLDEGWI